MAVSRKGKQHLFWLIAWVSGVTFILYSFLGDGGYLKLREQKLRLEELRRENSRLQQVRLDLESRIHKLKTDPRELERVAREQYNLARPGDIIVNVPRD